MSAFGFPSRSLPKQVFRLATKKFVEVAKNSSQGIARRFPEQTGSCFFGGATAGVFKQEIRGASDNLYLTMKGQVDNRECA